MRARNITIIGVLVALIVVAVYFGGFFSVILDGSITTSNFDGLRSCGRTNVVSEVDKFKWVYTSEVYPHNQFEFEPGYINDRRTVCIPTEAKLYIDNQLVYHYADSQEIFNIVSQVDPTPTTNPNCDGEKVKTVESMTNARWGDGNTIYQFPTSELFIFCLYDDLYQVSLWGSTWNSQGYETGLTSNFRINTKKLDISADVVNEPADILSNKRIIMEVNANTPNDISYSDICVNYATTGFFGVVREEQCNGQSGTLSKGQKQTFTFQVPNVDISEYNISVTIKNPLLRWSKFSIQGITMSDYLYSLRMSGTNYKLPNFRTEDVKVSYIDILSADIQQQLSYIDSLTLTLNELSDLINAMELSVDEQIFLLQELELTLEEQGELINNLNLEVDEQAQIINGLELNIEEQAVLIGTLNLKVQEQAQLISQLELNIEQQGQIIDSLNLEISQQAILINQLTTSLTEKARLVDLLQVENEEQAELINQMRLSFDDQIDIIDLLNYQVEEDAVIIANLQLSLTEKALLIESLRYTIDEKLLIINNLTQNVNEQAVIISNLQTTVEEKIVMIANLTQNLEEQAIIISSLKENVEEKARIIEGLQRTVDEQAVLINNLRTTLEEKERIIDELRISLAQKDEMKENLEGGANLTLIGGIALLVVFLIFLYQMWKGRKK